jgi:retron-type reverse transcriptase
VGIKLSGEPRIFFRTYKGVRQGDPSSPLLFNFAVDALATMLERVSVAGLIRGLVPVEEEYVANLKFILYCFENMSGLKINFHKSEVIVVGASKEEGLELLIV